MRFQLDLSFRDYIRLGDETTQALLDGPKEFVDAMEAAYELFAKSLWAGEPDLNPTAAFLAMNAFLLYLSGARMALTGHDAAIFPLFRTAVESACYAFLIAQDEDLGTVWLARHEDEAARKLCRRRFASAVGETAKKLDESRPQGGALLLESYEAAIDFGAHPNAKSVLGNLEFRDDDISEFQRVGMVALRSPDSFQVRRSIVACLDYAQVIGIVLAQCLPDVRDDTAAKLISLNEMKERLIASTG